VIAWLPIERIVVVKAADPPERVWAPRTVVPSLNVTAPVGVPVPVAAETTAVNVID
jgi:hypothetical protein